MEQQTGTVTAEWNGRKYAAIVNSYNVATIKPGNQPLSEPDHDEHQVLRWADDGGPA